MHDPPVPPALAPPPQADWDRAAQLLIDGCVYLPGAQNRVQMIERLCDGLGPALYPGLIGVLCLVGDRGSAAAKSAVAQTLVDALCSGRLPSGRLSAWGASTPAHHEAPGLQHRRSLGPVEYLCAWFAQPGASQPLSAGDFDQTMRPLLGLLSQAQPARKLYCERLIAMADDPLDGTLSRATRAGLRQLADAWQDSGADLQSPVDAFIRASQGTGLQAMRLPHPLAGR